MTARIEHLFDFSLDPTVPGWIPSVPKIYFRFDGFCADCALLDNLWQTQRGADKIITEVGL